MTPAQVKSVLDQHRKGMKWEETDGNLGISDGLFLANADAIWDGGQERVITVFSTPPGDPKVVAVLRNVSFAQSQAPTVENLAKSLNDKFGQPSRKSEYYDSTPILIWVWDKAGQILKPNSLNECLVHFALGTLSNMIFSRQEFTVPVLQHENDGGYAISVQGTIFSENIGIASRMELMLIDAHDALQVAIATDNHIKQVKQAKKEEELKNASANKQPAL